METSYLKSWIWAPIQDSMKKDVYQYIHRTDMLQYYTYISLLSRKEAETSLLLFFGGKSIILILILWFRGPLMGSWINYLFSPGAFDEFGVEYFCPPMLTLYIWPIREKVSNHSPVLSAIGVRDIPQFVILKIISTIFMPLKIDIKND